MKQPTDTEMLDWLDKVSWPGAYIGAQPNGSRTLITALGSVTAKSDSLRSCIRSGMKRWPIKPPTTKRRKSK